MFPSKSATTFSRFKLPLLYENVKFAVDKVLSEELPGSGGMAVSTDLWTSRANDNYQSLTIHFINTSWKLQNFVLNASQIKGRHTGEAISKKIELLMKDVPCAEDLPIVAVHDSAANMKNAMKRSQIIDIFLPCSDHLLQLAISGAVADCLKMSEAVKWCTALASKSHKSTLAKERIQLEFEIEKDEMDVTSEESENYAQIISPVATRWNSVTMMLKSVLKMRRALSNIRDNPGREDGNLSDVIPTEEDFDLFEECLDVMVCVAEISEAFSAENHPTINRVMSLLFELQSTIKKKLAQNPSAVAESFFRALNTEIEKRFPKCGGMVAAYAFGNMLNPFYRGVGVECISQNFPEMYSLLITNHENHQMWLTKTNQGCVSMISDEEEEDPLMALALSQDLCEAQRQPALSKSPIETEWEEYKSMQRPTKDDGAGNILNWWKANEKKFPLLAGLARRWLCIPASSASSERAFSSCGSIVSCKRTKLQPEKVDKLLYIQRNYDNVEIRRWKLVSKDKFDELPRFEDEAFELLSFSGHSKV